MTSNRLWPVITLNFEVDGRYHEVASAQAAAVCLRQHWPSKPGPKHKIAMRTCLAALSNQAPTEVAREAFLAAVNATMGVALLSDRHIRGEMQILTDRLPLPPSLAYVIRRARKSRNPPLDSLVREIERDIARQGGLALAG